jgi:chemotaxis protein CheX
MHQTIIQAFVSATTEVFRTMVGREVIPEAPYGVSAAHCEEDISALIGLSGGLPGTVIVGVDKSLAIDFTESVIGHSTTQIDEEVIDAVGEIANMIVGAAKCKLTTYKLSISLPSVICGRGLTVNFPRAVKPLCIPFCCEGSRLTLRIGLYDADANTVEDDNSIEVPEPVSNQTRGPVLAFNQL